MEHLSMICPGAARHRPIRGSLLEHQYPSCAHLEDPMNPVPALVNPPAVFERLQPAAPRSARSRRCVDATLSAARPDTRWGA